MSQFQQPQDNKYVRPGVQDLGTGRQFERLSVSQRGIGSTGGGRGGRFVQGQSRTGTGLSGVDPLAQLLGAASSGISAFLEADQTMVKAVDARTNQQLDELEQQRQDDLVRVDPTTGNVMSPEAAADLHRERLDNWRKKNGPLSKRGTARAKYKGMKRDAIKAISDFDFENEYLGIQDLITSFGGDETMTIEALEQWVSRYEGTPYEEAAIRQTREQLNSTRARKVNREIGEDMRETQHRFKGLLVEEGFGRFDAEKEFIPDPAKIHEFATSRNIDLSDEEAHLQLGEEFLGMMDSRLSGLDFASREAVIRNWSAMFDKEANNFVYMAKSYQQDIERENANASNARDWMTVLENPYSVSAASVAQDALGKSTRDIGPVAAEDRRQEAMVTFSRTAPAEYDKISPAVRSTHTAIDKGRAYAKTLVTDTVAAAGRVEDPELAIQILNNGRQAIPETLEEAVAMGWIPMVNGAPRGGLDEKGWQDVRTALDQEIRAAQAKHAEPFFADAAAIAVQTRDMGALQRLGDQLIVLAGEEETAQGRPGGFGLSEDGQSVKVLPLSVAGEVFGGLETRLLTAYNQLLSKTSSGAGESRVMTALRGGERGLGYEMKINGKDVEVPRSHFEASTAFNMPAEMFDDLIASGMSVKDATEKIKEELIATMADKDGNLPPMVMETLASLGMIPDNGAPPAMARGMLALGPSLGYQRTTGSTAGEGHRNIVGRQAQGMIADIMARANKAGGPGLVGDDALTIATMYMAAGTAEMREALFPNADDRLMARRASVLLKSTGTHMDGDEFRWSGATSEDFRGQDMTFTNVAAGYEFMEAAHQGGVVGFDKLENNMVEALLDPMAGLPDGGVPSPVQLAILKMKSAEANYLPELKESLGLPAETDMKLWLATNTNVTSIRDEISLRVANFLGTGEGQTAAQNPEEMAEALGSIVTEAITNRVQGNAIFDGFMREDKTGGIRQLQQRSGKGTKATGGDLLSAALDFSVHDLVLKRGMTVMTPEATAEHLGYRDMGDHFVDAAGNPVELQDNSAGTYQAVFQDMFKDIKVDGQPLFSGDDLDFPAVWQKALKATPNKDPRQVSMGDLLFHAWDKEGKDGKNFTRTQKAFENTEILVEDDKIMFRIPQLNVQFEYVAPATQAGGLAPTIASHHVSINEQSGFKVTPEVRQQQRDQSRARYLNDQSQPGHFMVPRTTADGRTPQG